MRLSWFRLQMCSPPLTSSRFSPPPPCTCPCSTPSSRHRRPCRKGWRLPGSVLTSCCSSWRRSSWRLRCPSGCYRSHYIPRTGHTCSQGPGSHCSGDGWGQLEVAPIPLPGNIWVLFSTHFLFIVLTSSSSSWRSPIMQGTSLKGFGGYQIDDSAKNLSLWQVMCVIDIEVRRHKMDTISTECQTKM